MRFGMTITGLAALGFAACVMDGDMMDNAVDDHGDAVAELRSASSRHADAAARAGSLEEMRGAENAHRSAIDFGMSHMRNAMDRSRGGMCGAMSGSRMMRDVAREMDDHRDRMNAARDLDEARAEEQRHNAWMDEELGYMDDDHQMMHGMMNMCGC